MTIYFYATNGIDKEDIIVKVKIEDKAEGKSKQISFIKNNLPYLKRYSDVRHISYAEHLNIIKDCRGGDSNE